MNTHSHACPCNDWSMWVSYSQEVIDKIDNQIKIEDTEAFKLYGKPRDFFVRTGCFYQPIRGTKEGRTIFFVIMWAPGTGIERTVTIDNAGQQTISPDPIVGAAFKDLFNN